MNIRNMIFKNLKNLVVNNTVVFVIIMLALVVSTVTVTYIVVKTDSNSDYVDNSQMDLDSIRLKSDEDIAVSDDIFKRISEHCKNDDRVLSCECNFNSEDGEMITCFVYNEQKLLHEQLDKMAFASGRALTDDEISGGKNVYVSVGLSYTAGEIDLDGVTYECVGRSSRNGETNGYIPQLSALNNKLVPVSYNILYDHDLSISEFGEIMGELEKEFPEFKVENQADFQNENYSRRLNKDNIFLLLVAFIAVIACAYIYTYILQKRLGEICIFKICGASRQQLVGMFTIEMCCILLLQYVLSFAVVKFILIPFIREYDFAFVYFFSAKHLIISYSLFTFITLIVFFPLLLRYCGKYAMTLKQERKG